MPGVDALPMTESGKSRLAGLFQDDDGGGFGINPTRKRNLTTSRDLVLAKDMSSLVSRYRVNSCWVLGSKGSHVHVVSRIEHKCYVLLVPCHDQFRSFAREESVCLVSHKKQSMHGLTITRQESQSC